jgi:hypothetical protein
MSRRADTLVRIVLKLHRMHYPSLLASEEIVDVLLERQKEMEEQGWYQGWDEVRGLARNGGWAALPTTNDN